MYEKILDNHLDPDHYKLHSTFWDEVFSRDSISAGLFSLATCLKFTTSILEFISTYLKKLKCVEFYQSFNAKICCELKLGRKQLLRTINRTHRYVCFTKITVKEEQIK